MTTVQLCCPSVPHTSCAQSLQSEAVDRSRSLNLCRVVGVAFSVSGRTLSQHLRNLRSAPKILRFRVDLISRPHSVHACARPTVSARPLAIERLSLTRCAAGLRCSLGHPIRPQTNTHTTTTAERRQQLLPKRLHFERSTRHGLLQRPLLACACSRPPAVVGAAAAALPLRYRPQPLQPRQDTE